QEQRGDERVRQEGRGFLLILVLALEHDVDLRRQIRGLEPRGDLAHHRIRQHVFLDVGRDRHDSPAVGALQVADARRGRSFDERRDGHEAVRGLHPKLVETVEIAVRGREPDADVDLVVGIVRAVVADQDAVRHELDRVADRRDIRAEARGFGAVDGKPPFDARNRPAIGDIDQARHAIEMRANLRDRLGQELGPPRRYLDLDWLAGRRSRVLLLGLDDDPGDLAGALPDFAQDLRGRPPQLPIDVTELDAADQIFFVLAAEANARARVDRLDLRHAENALLDLPDERIALGDRKIAPCADLDCRLRRLDGREELEPAAERGIRRVYADEKHGAGEEHLAGMLDEPAERGDIAMADGAQAFERVLDEQQALVRVTL